MLPSADYASRVATRPPPPPPPPAHAAQHVVAQATDPATRTVNTRQLAGWVSDAAHTSPAKASEAYAQIEGQLSLGDRSRFAQDVAASARSDQVVPATGGAQGIVATGSRVLKENPILKVEWHAFTTPVNNRSGLSGPLKEVLDRHGIDHDFGVQPHPPAAVASNAKGTNTRNGNAARDALADQFRARGLEVRTEQTLDVAGRDIPGVVAPKGGRRIDVVAIQRAANPENNVRIDAEVKLGYAGGSRAKTEAAKDGARLAENVTTREMGTALKAAGKTVRPIGIALDIAQVGVAVKEDGGHFGDHTQHAVGSLAGGAAGAWAGAEAGAVIGSFGGPVGTVVGGLAGAAIGGFIGSGVGEKAVDWVKDIF